MSSRRSQRIHSYCCRKERSYYELSSDCFGGNTLPGGGWGLGLAKASPTATSFTVLSAYPADPTHDKTTYTFTSSTWSWIDTWTEKGKPMTGKGNCTKQ